MAEPVPPKFAVLPAWLLYDRQLSKPVLVTGGRIWGLGWRYRYEQTGPLTVEELCQICDVERSTLYGHLAQLTSASVFSYTSTRRGELVFRFDVRPGEEPPAVRVVDGDLVTRLAEYVTERGARHLVESYDEERIEAALLTYERGRETGEIRGTGWLIQAITKGWKVAPGGDAAGRDDGRRFVEGEYAEFIRS